MPEGLLMILYSANGRDGWTLVKPEDVPAWVKTSENVARMVHGDMCCDPSTGDEGWYRVEKVSSEGETKQ
jgi:hypothetical protein